MSVLCAECRADHQARTESRIQNAPSVNGLYTRYMYCYG